jgi:molybdopterin-guanine dinucleotide biosynthesis adapter protein
MLMPPVISIVGKSNSGKTTLIEKLIPELKKRGYAIGIIKHAHHGFDIDQEGKDSWRHKKAGADTVIVASANEISMTKKENHVDLDQLIKYFDDVDLVITEGYKREKKPKIEVFRSTRHKTPLCRESEEWVALVSDIRTDLNIPTFGLEEIERITDFIEKKFLMQNKVLNKAIKEQFQPI